MKMMTMHSCASSGRCCVEDVRVPQMDVKAVRGGRRSLNRLYKAAMVMPPTVYQRWLSTQEALKAAHRIRPEVRKAPPGVNPNTVPSAKVLPFPKLNQGLNAAEVGQPDELRKGDT
jgi:hypothetical protein